MRCEYDKLVIASGAEAVRPNIEGADLDNVFFMRTPEDAYVLRDAIETGNIKRAVIVGGGYVGLEIAENLNSQGVRAVVIDMAKHILPGFDDEISEYVETTLQNKVFQSSQKQDSKPY